ncbi:MAG: acetate--CoA ligase family protein [Pseudomonadota bacterium]|nr:acetate--CoA ligase family protein [Pseudomonadota bacterium]
MTNQIRRLFSPASVAVVGASTSFEKAGSQLVHALRDFDGAVYPINPTASEIQGLKAYPNLASLPQAPDLVAMAVPASATPAVMREAAAAKAGGALIIGGGFAETGPDGAALQSEMLQAARAGNVRLLGPNTSGFFNPARGCYATFAPGTETIGAGSVAIIAQSGGVNLTLSFLLARAGAGISMAVGLGNAADVTASDVLEYLMHDEATKVIGLHLEGVMDGRRLYETLRRVTPIKPVVVLTVGRADSGEFAQSHTGALLGGYELKVSALRQAGAVVVNTTEALVDACAALCIARLAPNPQPGVALITGQAGPGLLIVDNLRAAGISMPALSDGAYGKITKLLPPLTFMKNPVDTGRPSPRFGDVLEAVTEDPGIDLVCVSALNEPDVLDVATVLGKAAAGTSKPLLYCGMGAAGVFEQVLAATRARGVPAYGSPERLVGAVTALVEDAKTRSRALSAGPIAVSHREFSLPAGGLDEVGAKSLLQTMGLTCPKRYVCENRETAHAAFDAHGRPMVVKVIDKAILHKTEVGGVHVNVRSREDLDRALDRIDAIPGSPRGYLLEDMAPSGLELIIGAARDPSFGPVVLVGLGGTLAEALKDVSRRVAPITSSDAEEMLDELRGHPLLNGWRGAPAVSRPAIVEAMLALSAIIVSCEPVTEIEINPFRAYPDGGLVLDALVVYSSEN